MSNIDQWNFDELQNSKIIITEDVYNRLIMLIGRTSWTASEHSSTLFGKKLEGEDIWVIDEVNASEDYISRGENSTNVIDVHTHPAGLIEDFRFLSSGDITEYIKYNEIVSNKGGTFFAGLIGCDRVNGNMSFSIVWYNKLNNKFYRIKDIYLRRRLGNGDYRDFPFVKYGNTQLIMQTWGDQNADINQLSQEELTRFSHR